MKKLSVLSVILGSTMPFLALAQTNTGGRCTGIGLGTIEGIICKVGDILSIIIPILMVAAVAYFIWGVISFVISDDEEAKTKGRDRMIFGIIGLVVIVAVWGLVGILNNTFGLGAGTAAPTLPTLPY